MTTGGARLLRGPRGPRRAIFLELFFDLVFVATLVQLSRGLMRDLSWGGAFQTLVLLLAMWWTWSITTWTTNLYDPQRMEIQFLSPRPCWAAC